MHNSMLKVHDTLRFKFYTVISRNAVRPDCYQDDPERIILCRKPDGSLGTNDFGVWALRHTPADQKAAFTLLDDAQAPDARIDLVYKAINFADFECKMMQADITPLEFSPLEYEHMKVLGALDNLPHDLGVRKSDLLQCLPRALTCEFPEPEWPRPQTEDDYRPALATHVMLTITPSDYSEVIAAQNPQKDPGAFGFALLEKAGIHSGAFNRVAQSIGRQMLMNKNAPCKMVLLTSLYSFRDTVPPTLQPTHTVLRKEVLGAIKKVEKTSPSLDLIRQLIEKTP